ncbi:MAG: histidine kinase [Mesorhizobium sp.]|uniref:HWE histidine kinase domain-containing protein n=1 Tax=unclassified Mesorhizobium TaxID=325217 RepID=UPI000FCC1986|nr:MULTISPECIES: HWE histidine kinase domain-containing protein [unclassified Mesorhizobium]RUV75908.1 histidine kinase [Mesorhizobium sp. M5C.F.Cr.IN.023.01.1.1]RWF85619.1 MAG: histidine kinase [Mesorhizobium sp.]RWF95302.1 MAG: histidine kinase [Mesorhizobium sp.]RWI39863.1 MAG: histidine kinase [Mesorhizobium sp.]RWI45271.1 MAG: histidine kinase [Mesorhizobium sp.]
MNMEDLYRLLRTGHVQLQGIVDTVVDPLLVLDEGLSVQNASRSFFETFKVDRDETIGQHIYELGNGQWDIPELRHLLSAVIPKSMAVINYEVEHDFPDIGRRTMLLTARTLHHPDNGSRSLLLSMVDATDRYRRDAAKDMQFGELRHRIKNLLAVAQSIARHTTTEGRSAEEYRDDFLGRFNALVQAQDIAFVEQDEPNLVALLERILAPYTANPDAIVIGPGVAVELDTRALQSLSLVLHELATNAAKYGALSVSDGQVRVSWRIEEGNCRLRLRWVESGGPPVTPPATTGYGTELIQSATTYSLGGQVELKYLVGGLETEIVIPLGSAARPG